LGANGGLIWDVTFKTIQVGQRKIETAWGPWVQRMDAHNTVSRSRFRKCRVGCVTKWDNGASEDEKSSDPAEPQSLSRSLR
jgi:hypothetical protein